MSNSNFPMHFHNINRRGGSLSLCLIVPHSGTCTHFNYCTINLVTKQFSQYLSLRIINHSGGEHTDTVSYGGALYHFKPVLLTCAELFLEPLSVQNSIIMSSVLLFCKLFLHMSQLCAIIYDLPVHLGPY